MVLLALIEDDGVLPGLVGQPEAEHPGQEEEAAVPRVPVGGPRAFVEATEVGPAVVAVETNLINNTNNLNKTYNLSR